MPIPQVRSLVLDGSTKFRLAEELYCAASHNDAGFIPPAWHAVCGRLRRLQDVHPCETIEFGWLTGEEPMCCMRPAQIAEMVGDTYEEHSAEQHPDTDGSVPPWSHLR